MLTFVGTVASEVRHELDERTCAVVQQFSRFRRHGPPNFLAERTSENLHKL